MVIVFRDGHLYICSSSTSLGGKDIFFFSFITHFLSPALPLHSPSSSSPPLPLHSVICPKRKPLPSRKCCLPRLHINCLLARELWLHAIWPLKPVNVNCYSIFQIYSSFGQIRKYTLIFSEWMTYEGRKINFSVQKVFHLLRVSFFAHQMWQEGETTVGFSSMLIYLDTGIFEGTFYCLHFTGHVCFFNSSPGTVPWWALSNSLFSWKGGAVLLSIPASRRSALKSKLQGCALAGWSQACCCRCRWNLERAAITLRSRKLSPSLLETQSREM